jgi:hypothetical protein
MIQCRGVFLGGDAGQAGHELSLAESVVLRQPCHAPFVDQVHGFDSLQRSPGALKGSVCFGEPETFLHCALILLHDVVQIFTLTETARDAAKAALP